MSKLSKSKILLGVMIVMVMLVGVLVVMPKTSNAANCTISMTLKQGMRNTEVSCLQSLLNVTPNTGYFGTITKAAVMAFQKTNSLTADGIVGKNTLAVLGGTVVTLPTQDLCPNGMTLASNCMTSPTVTPSQTLCPNGMTLASNCMTAPSVVVSQGTCPSGYVAITPVAPTFAACSLSGVVVNSSDGSITASTSSYVSSGVQLKKGDTKDVVAMRLQAVQGPTQVTRADVHFSVRPWLFFSTVTLHDSTGNILATMPMTDASSSTEITAGSDYLVTFDNLKYTVTPGTISDLVVGVSVLPATDKITNGMTVYAGITQIRTINGIGYTDSVSGTGFPASSGTGENSFTLSSTGSVADMYSRISPNSPAAGQQTVSASQTTPNVVLGVFSLKSANNASTLNSLKVVIANNTLVGGVALTTATSQSFSNIRMMIGGQSYGGLLGTNNDMTAAGAPCLSGAPNICTSVTFSNLPSTLILSQDVWTDVTIEADVTANAAGTAFVYMIPSTSTIVATDTNYNTTTVETGSTPAGNVQTLTTNAVVVSNMTASQGTAIVQGNNTVGYAANYSFTLTNYGNNDLYLSSVPGIVTGGTDLAIGTYTITSTGGSTAGTGLGTVTLNQSTVNGDDLVTNHVYALPANTSRTFSFAGAIYENAAANTVSLAITKINYGIVNTNPNSLHLTANLTPLSITAHF